MFSNQQYSFRSCTRNCFYCPQDRNEAAEKRPNTDRRLEFDSPSQYVRYLEAFNFEGIAFSGGEPFLAFDTMIQYIRKIRRSFGSRHYIWAYTNGDLVTEERLIRLKDAGLDELRFDISANDYRLAPAALAANHMDAVAVEIPAIPEDLDRVKSSLKRMEDMGVRFLNVHQLMATKHNYRAFMKRNYTVTNTDSNSRYLPVVESELAALELLKHAVERNSTIGINYCSEHYKGTFQEEGLRKRYAPLLLNKAESITGTGFIRRLTAKGRSDQLKNLWEILNAGERSSCVRIDENGPSMIRFPPDLFRKIMASDCCEKINVSYVGPKIKIYSSQNEKTGKELDFGAVRTLLKKKAILDFDLLNSASALFFHQLFIEKKNHDETAAEAVSAFDMEENDITEIMEDIASFRGEFEALEFRPSSLPAYN
ncbi:MAG: radical SAM protein [Deltaproteobacteria bacterium]|nr:radical SAM protein [Deltaproteobacteria bacterium]